MALHALQKSYVNEGEQGQNLGGHPGLWTIFGSALSDLDEANEWILLRSNADATFHTAEFPYSWTLLYTFLAVLHKSSPCVPVGVLSGLWGIAVDLAMSVCRCFDNLGLGTCKSQQSLQTRGFQNPDSVVQTAFRHMTFDFTTSSLHAV
jgi:hypothetical protein